MKAVSAKNKKDCNTDFTHIGDQRLNRYTVKGKNRNKVLIHGRVVKEKMMPQQKTHSHTFGYVGLSQIKLHLTVINP